eukprot:3938012-Rhodomonas_salina.1
MKSTSSAAHHTHSLSRTHSGLRWSVGETQGAYMGALYAQKLHTSCMEEGVTELAEGIGSLMGLMRDLTLPLLSMFSGKSFSHTIRH